MANAVVIAVGMTTKELVAGAQEAAGTVRKMGDEFRGRFPAAANEASRELGGFTDRMRDFRREQVQQGRLVGFYVKELTEFTGMGKEAQNVIAGLGNVLVEGLMGGLGIGVAIEGVKLLAIAFREWGTAASEASAKAKQAMKDLHKDTTDTQAEVDKLRATKAGESEDEYKANEARRKQLAALDGLQKQLNVATQQRLNAEAASGRQEGPSDTEKRLQGEIDKINLALSFYRQLGETRDRLLKGEAAYDYLPPEVRVERAGGTSRELQDVVDANKKKGEAAAKAFWSEWERATKAYKPSTDYQPWATPGAGYTPNGADIFNRKQQLDRYRGMGSMTGSGSWSVDLVSEQKELDKSIAQWNRYADSVGDAIAKVVAQQGSLGQAVAAGALQGARSVLSAVRKEIMAYMLEAAMAAYKAHAGVPFVGLAMGAVAAGVAMAFGEGLLGRLESAAGGWAIPFGQNPVVQAHGGEHIIPAYLARRYEEGAPGGSEKAAPYAPTYNLAFLDPSGARKFFRENARYMYDEYQRFARYR